MLTRRAFILPFLLLALAAAAPAAPSGFSTIAVGGFERTYEVEQVGPANAPGKLPVIVFLHGSQTDIRQPISPRFDLPFGDVPGMESALLVRPQGFDGRWASTDQKLQPWRRVWRLLTGRPTERPDEVAFLDALVARVVAERHGDPARVYVAGVSSGGGMVLRLACAPHQPFAAYAALLATAEAQPMPACMTQPPVSLMLLASTTDPVVDYRGHGKGGVDRLSVPETVAAFAGRDHCATRAETLLQHFDADVPSTVSLIRYEGCAADSEVLFYRVDGSGHSVPSTRPPEPGDWTANGARNRDIESAASVWAFFRRHEDAGR